MRRATVRWGDELTPRGYRTSQDEGPERLPGPRTGRYPPAMGEPWIDPFPVHTTEIDGVPTYWIDGAPPLSATLWFRVGFADETLPQLGITHLLEHLLLGEGEIRRISNGSVDDLFTRFSATGNQDEIVGFLHALSRDIARPPIERLDIERHRVLAETDHETRGPCQHALDTGCGAQASCRLRNVRRSRRRPQACSPGDRGISFTATHASR